MRHSLSEGFTIVELIVVIALSGILFGMLFGPLNELYRSNATGAKTIAQIGDTRGALRSIENDITLAIRFLKNNTITDPGHPVPWSWTGGDNSVLITESYGTDKAQTNEDRQLAKDSNCSDPVKNNYVFFVDNKTLYKRIITDKSICGGINAMHQKQTCATINATIGCLKTDIKVIDDVNEFKVDYYPQSTSNTTTSDVVNAQTVNITLSTGVDSYESTSNIRITRINGVAS